jgi:RecB family exonuclease
VPIKPEKRITAVSYSRYLLYKECPLKCYLQNVAKIQDTSPSTAMDRGTVIHNMAAAYVGGEVPKIDQRDGDRLKPYETVIKAAAKGKLPKDIATFKNELAKVRKLGTAIVEQEWAFDVNWKPTTWFAMHGPTAAFLRVKVDLHYVQESVLPIIDFKTGKVYAEKNKEQLELYGLAGLLMYPAVKLVQAALWYTDAGHEEKLEVKREELPKLKKTWMTRFAPVLNDRQFGPRPNEKCRWCFYRKSNTANNGTGKELCPHG